MKLSLKIVSAVITLLAFLQPIHSVALDIIDVVIPSTISISSVTFPGNDGTSEATFTVTTNEGFDISFSGNSTSDSGGTNNYPLFVKQDQDASGSLIVDSYDHLTTTFGVTVTDAESTEENNRHWHCSDDNCSGAGDIDGTPENLVLPLNQTVPAVNSPDAAFGRIMPGNATGEWLAKVHLFTKAVAEREQQSGNYTMTVTITVTSNPE